MKNALFRTAEADSPHYPGWRHLAFTVDHVDATLSEMDNEAILTIGPRAFDDFSTGWKAVWVKDPAGIIVELSEG